jgi:hypothetical protein
MKNEKALCRIVHQIDKPDLLFSSPVPLTRKQQLELPLRKKHIQPFQFLGPCDIFCNFHSVILPCFLLLPMIHHKKAPLQSKAVEPLLQIFLLLIRPVIRRMPSALSRPASSESLLSSPVSEYTRVMPASAHRLRSVAKVFAVIAKIGTSLSSRTLFRIFFVASMPSITEMFHIYAAGCHFTGLVALRHSLSTALPRFFFYFNSLL